MKRSAISRSDPEVIREWQRRGVEAAQAKRRKRDAERLRKEERAATRSNRVVQVFPEYVTPIVVRSVVERNRRAADPPMHPARVPMVGERSKFNGQTIVCRESDDGPVVEAFFRSSHTWHPPMIVARKHKGYSWARVRVAMLEAAGYRCQAAASPGCRVAANHVHHVLPRGRGGKDDGSTPLLVVCFVCHQWIHEHPYASREREWLV